MKRNKSFFIAVGTKKTFCEPTMMEDTHRTEGQLPSTLPLHLQNIERSYTSRRVPGDEPDGMSRFPDSRRRLNSSMSKRMSSGVSSKNNHGGGEASYNNFSTPMDGYYVSHDTASTASLSSLSQTDHKKYSRRKNKKKRRCPQTDQLFLLMVVLVVLSGSFALYSAPKISHSITDIDDIPGFGFRTKNGRPRIVALDALGQFGNFQYNPHRMGDKFVANLGKLAKNNTVVLYDDLSSLEIDTSAAESQPETSEAEKKCLPMAKWMTASFPNCNSVHEIDMHHGVMTRTFDDEDDLQFLGQGWFRDTWKYANENLDGSPAVVLKTLRIEREFLDEYFDLHRRDAVAMERLTFSPYVVDVFGYCGQSAINELAEGIMDGKITNLEKLNRRLRGKESDPKVLLLKLQLAVKVAVGLAHIHNIHVSDEIGSRSKSVHSLLYEHTDPNSSHSTTGFGRSVATMTHYDINPRNIAVMKGGNPKLNDFNIAEFMTYDPETNQTCGFRSRLHEPWWRAPEEMDLSNEVFVDEKVDIYALGEVLFHILTTHGPRGKMKKFRMDEVRALVKDGIPPTMWEPYASDSKMKKNPIVKAFMKAMDLCFEKDPKKRGTSIQVARILHKALMKEEESREKARQKEKS